MAPLVLLLTALTFAGESSSAGSSPGATQVSSGESYEFEFSGVFTWGEVVTSLCREGWCRTKLPREFHQMSVPLNVFEKTFDDAFKALSFQAKADGYILTKTGRKRPYTVSAELDQERTASYISCLDTAVHSVPAVDLVRYRRADSLRCAARDGIADSLVRLSNTIQYPVARYRVSFYVVSSSFVRDLGVEWTDVWANGNLYNIPEFITSWTLKAVAANDTTAEFRSVELDIDSTAFLHWGSQRKEEKSTIVYSNGLAQNDWEWRDYGLTLTLSRSPKTGIRGQYELSQRDENNSVLKGNFGGGGSDSIVAYGVYDSYQNNFKGIPWLYKIPFIGYLFGTETVDKVKSFFVIQIYRTSPKDSVFKDFPTLDSLMREDIKLYSRLKDTTETDSTQYEEETDDEYDEEDTPDSQLDTLYIPQDTLAVKPD